MAEESDYDQRRGIQMEEFDKRQKTRLEQKQKTDARRKRASIKAIDQQMVVRMGKEWGRNTRG